MIRLRTALLPVIPLAAAALWFGHHAPTASASAPVAPRVIVAPGHVEPLRDPVALAFETPGRIVSNDVEEGEAVRAGQIVARLDDRLPKARVAEAQAQVAAAEARFELARRGPRHEDVEAARAEAEAAAVDADHRGVERARSVKLGEVGAVPSAAVDADSAAARVANAAAAAASARFQSLAKGTRAEQITAAAAELEAVRAELDAATIALDQTLLRAPTDGVVLRRLAEAGAFVTTVTPIPVVTVADVSRLELRTEIDEADIADIAMGKPAYATADAYGDRRFPVRITKITRELGRKTVRDDDPRARFDTRVLEVIARFDDAADLPLGLRMAVHVER
jgi:multidrug resistance efflux pump